MQPTLSIHVTDLCNSKCSFCVVGSPLYTKNTVVYEDIQAFLRENASQGFEAVNLHGGEATIHPRFVDILGEIRALGYPEVHLQTNAIKLSDPGYAKRLVELGVGLFIISLHGDQPDVQDDQTGTPGGLVRTLRGIRNVHDLGARIRTNTVITNRNVERLLEIVTLACDLGVDHINLSNLHPVGSAFFGFDKLVPPFEVIRASMEPALDHAIGRGRRVTLEGFPYCVVPGRETLHLNEQGRRIRMLMRGQVLDNYDQFMNGSCRELGAPCQACSVRTQCGGVYREYAQFRGWNEFSPIVAPGESAPEVSQLPVSKQARVALPLWKA